MGRNIVLLAVILMLSGCGTGKFRKSEVIFSDTYYLEDADNMEFVFSDDSTLTVRQKGIYELTENEEGEAAAASYRYLVLPAWSDNVMFPWRSA